MPAAPPRLGYVGLGLMGAPMARRLLAADYPLTVWNRDPAKAAVLAALTESRKVAVAPPEVMELVAWPYDRFGAQGRVAERREVADLGVTFAVGIDERMDMAAKVGAHRTSMLQDVEAGRPTELDALLGVVIELAGMVNVDTPSLQMVYDLVKFRSQIRGA